MIQKKKILHKERIAAELEEKIKTGIWQHGQKLPAMRDLCGQFDVSMITMVGVMKTLEERGIVTQKQGSGTYVTWKRENIFFPNITNTAGRNVQVTYSLLGASPLYMFIIKQLADRFMQFYGKVNINVMNMEFANNPQDDPYIIRIANHDMPTCGEFFWHAMYAKLDALVPLEQLPEFAELQNSLHPQAFYPSTNSSGTPHYHALYLKIDIPTYLLCNQNWLQNMESPLPKYGIGWATLFRLLRRSVKKKSELFASALPWPNGFHGIKFYLELLGQDILNDTYNPHSPQLVHDIVYSDSAEIALNYLQEFLGNAPQHIIFGKENQYFALNQVGLLPSASSWALELIATLNIGMPVRAFAFPGIRANTVYHPFYSGFNVGIFRDGISSDAQLQAAWSWLKFLFSSQAQELLSHAMAIPVNKDATSHLERTLPEVNELALKSLKNAKPQPDFVGMRHIYSRLSPTLQEFLQQKISADVCLKRLRETITAEQKLSL